MSDTDLGLGLADRSGLQPSESGDLHEGLRPSLVWDAPLALMRVQRQEQKEKTTALGFEVQRLKGCGDAGGVAGPSTALRSAQDDKFGVE